MRRSSRHFIRRARPLPVLALLALFAAGLGLGQTPAAAQSPEARRAARPATRPATRPAARPAARPTDPATRPAARPTDPAARPAAAPPKRKGAAAAAAAAATPARRAEPRPKPADRPRTAPRPTPRRDLAPQPKPKGGDKDPEDTRMRQLQGAAWALLGVTVMMLTATGVFALMVEDREDEIERMSRFVDPYSTPPNRPLTYDGVTRRDYELFMKEGKRFEIATYAFLGLSVAALISSGALFLADYLKQRSTPAPRPRATPARADARWRLQPTIGPQGASLSFGMEF